MTGTFITQRTDVRSRHYEKSTPRRRGRLDTCPFSVTSLKACLSTVSCATVPGAFARHGDDTSTHARTNGGLDDE